MSTKLTSKKAFTSLSSGPVSEEWIKYTSPSLVGSGSVTMTGPQLAEGDLITDVIIKITETISFSGGGSNWDLTMIGNGPGAAPDFVSASTQLTSGTILEFSKSADESNLTGSNIINWRTYVTMTADAGTFASGAIEAYFRRVTLY